MILVTMFWDYTTNPLGQTNPLAVLVTSLTTMASKQAPDQVSLGMLALFAVTGLVALAIMVSDYVQSNGTDHRARDWLSSGRPSLAIMAGMGLVYAIIHAAQLGPGVNLRNLVYEYYVVLRIVGAALAIILYRRLPHPANSPRGWRALAYGVGILSFSSSSMPSTSTWSGPMCFTNRACVTISREPGKERPGCMTKPSRSRPTRIFTIFSGVAP